MDDELVWGWVAEERLDLADALDDLDPAAWDAASLCAGWKIRDVLGHLVWLAEGNRRSIMTDLSRQLRPPNAAMARIARRHGETEPPVLVSRLRDAAEGRFVAPTQPPAAALGEVLTHRIDALRPVGGTRRAPDERTRTAADAYRNIGLVFGVGRAARKVRFVASDAGWAVGPEDGPEATGPGDAVLLALAGRREGRMDLSGPGARLLGG